MRTRSSAHPVRSRRCLPALPACFSVALATALAIPAVAAAAAVQVNKTDDHDDGNCTAADCTLREAIVHSNAGDVVSVPVGTYTLKLGQLTVSHNLTINGVGATQVKIDGANASRVLEVASGVSLTLTGVTIQHGQGPNAFPLVGGGIRVVGNLTLRNSTLTHNQAADGAGMGTDDPAASATLDHVNITDNGTAGVGGGGGIDQDKGGSLTIKASTITNNKAVDGAGVFTGAQKASDRLVITDSTISGNTASNSTLGAGGGGLNCDCGPLTFNITRTKVTGNTANIGGGMYDSGAPVLTVTDSTFSGNHAKAVGGGQTGGGCGACEDGSGGAFLEDGGGHYHFVRSTINGNTADLHGGATYSIGSPTDFTISNSTITNNTAGGGGGAFRIDSTGQMTVSNSTIAGNSAVGPSPGTRAQIGLCDSAPTYAFPSCSPKITFTDTIVSAGKPVNCAAPTGGTIASGGSNIDSGTTCGFSAAGDKSNTNPKLGPLASNGGPTKTMALLTGSPAINAVVSGCPPPASDQRGVGRPKGPKCDIGAFERAPTAAHKPTITITTPSDGAHYTVGQKVNASYHCSDADGASDVKSCQGTVPNGQPIDTGTKGSHSFTVNASDKEGNTAKKTVHYTVRSKPGGPCPGDQDRLANGRCATSDDDEDDDARRALVRIAAPSLTAPARGGGR